jgi:hypothetical protein
MHYNFIANANTRVAEHCYKKGREEKFHRSTISTTPSSAFLYAVLAILFMNVGTVSRVIIFTRHMRLWLVDNSDYQE